MTTIISAIAIILSLVSFGFSIYQHKIGNKITINEKASNLLKQIYDLRRRIEDKKTKYSNTDDIPDYANIFNSQIEAIENVLAPFLQNAKVSIDNVYKLERAYLDLHLELDLFFKQTEEIIRFNKECVDAGKDPIEFDNYE